MSPSTAHVHHHQSKDTSVGRSPPHTATGSGDFGHQGTRPACCCPPTVIHRTRGFPSPQCLLTPAFRSAFHHLPSLCSFAFSRGLQHPPPAPQGPAQCTTPMSRTLRGAAKEAQNLGTFWPPANLQHHPMETPTRYQNSGAARGLQNTSTSNVRAAAPGAGHCSCTWRRQGACDFIPFGAEPGIEPNTPSCYKQLFDIFNDLSLGRQQLWRAECHRLVLSIPAKWCLVTPGSLSPSSSSSLLCFAREDNQGPLPCISAPSYHTPSVCKAPYPVSCFSQDWSSLSSSPSPFSLAVCTAPSSLLCGGQGSAGVEAITSKAW